MDYEKEYKEALERAKKLQENSNGMILKKWLWAIFPELKESEDEKVRKELIMFIKKRDRSGCDYDYNKWIAWVEKQGDYANFRDKAQVGDRITKNEDGVLVNLSQLERVTKPSKKQCEQKAGYTTIVETGDGGINALVTRELPTDGEQKSANKVESNFTNFKIGDWVVENGVNRNPVQITSFEEDKGVGIRVWFSNGTGIYIEFLNGYHKWTIQDAKDGDILWHSDSASNGIFIFKEIRHDGKVLCYCDYDSEDHFCTGEHHTCCWSNAKYIKPATKTQRNLLFAKMREAGYEWDSKKKELKLFITNGGDFESEICEQKPAEWSEEDEEKFRDVIRLIEQGAPVQSIKDHYTNWLKSLKQRNTWKPSEEQLKLLQRYADQNSYDGTVLTSLLNDLKKLIE